MIIRFIIIFLLLVLFVWIGIEIHKDPGYVLVTYQHWSLETTLWFALLAILVTFIILSLLVWFFRSTSTLSEKFRIWTQQHKLRKANKLTSRGLCELAEGNWKEAEKNLIRGAQNHDMPLINYLAAAAAAQEQDHFEDRDNYLREAHLTSPQTEIAIGLTQAQLQLRAKQWELALATLTHLNQLAPHHGYIANLLKRVYLELHDWKSLRELIPELRKYKTLKPGEVENLENQVYLEMLKAAVNSPNANSVTNVWQTLPKTWQTDPALLAVYIDYLMKENKDVQAEQLLRDALKKTWSPELIRYYGLVKGEEPEKQLAVAETWLKNHSNDPALLLCLGRLCIRNNLWDKAQNYLSSSIQLEPKAESYRELGRVLEQLKKPEAALDSYRKGLLALS